MTRKITDRQYYDYLHPYKLPQSGFSGTYALPQGGGVGGCSPAVAQYVQVISGSMKDTINPAASEYFVLGERFDNYTSSKPIPIPSDCYLTDAYFEINTAPGAGKSYNITISISTGLTELTFKTSIANTDTTARLTVDNDFEAPGRFLKRGDTVSILIQGVSTPTAFTSLEYEIHLVPKTLGEKFIFWKMGAEGASFVGDKAHTPFSDNTDLLSAVYNPIIPIAGTFKNFIAHRTSPQEGAGNSVTKFITNNTDVTEATMWVENDSGYDTNPSTNKLFTTANTLHFDAGEELGMHAEGTATTTTRETMCSCVFVPDNIDEHFYINATDDSKALNVEYRSPMNQGQTVGTAAWTSVQADREIVWPFSESLSDFYSKWSGTPGGTGSTLSVINQTAIDEVRGGTTQVDIVHGAGDATKSNLVDSLPVVAGDRLVLKCDASGATSTLDLQSFSFKGTLTTPVSSETPIEHFTMFATMSALTDTGFTVKAATASPRCDVQLVVSTVGTRAGFVAAITNTGAVGTDTTLDLKNRITGDTSTINYVECSITGLTENTTYYWALKSNGTVDVDSIYGPVTTLLSEGTEVGGSVTHRYCWASCSDPEDNATGEVDNKYPVLRQVNALSNVRLFLHQGDFTYHNISTDDKPLARRHFIDHVQSTDFQDTFTTKPFIWTPSDHDVGPSDHNNTTVGAATFLPANYQAAREVLPYYPLAQDVINFTQGMATSFYDGKVGIIVLDTQCQRHPTKASGVTMLGDGGTTDGTGVSDDMAAYVTWDQRQWLFDTLAAMKTAGAKLVIVAGGGAKMLSSDSWRVDYLAEWEVICDTICDNTKDYPEVIFTHGDTHNTSFSDGADADSTTEFSSTFLGQFPVVCAAPILDGVTETPSGTQTWNSVAKSYKPASNQIAGVIEVVKDTTSHEYDYNIKAIDQAGTEQLTTGLKSAVTRTVDFNLGSSSLTHPGVTGTRNITIDKTWLGAFKITVTATGGTLTAGTDYTLSTSFGTSITSGTPFVGHPNANTTDIVVTFLTYTLGTIELTLSAPDSGSTLGATTIHTLTLTTPTIVITEPKTATTSGALTGGMAPYTVHVDAYGNTPTAGPLRKGTFFWDFGDAGSKTIDEARKGSGTFDPNTQYTRAAAYTYESPGTYTVNLTYYDQDLNVHVASARQVVVTANTRSVRYVDATGGNDANDGLGTGTAWKTYSYALSQITGPDMEIRFKDDETFPVTADTDYTVPQNNILLTNYGGGTNDPIIEYTGAHTSSKVLCNVTGANSVIQNLYFKDDGSADSANRRRIFDCVNDATFMNLRAGFCERVFSITNSESRVHIENITTDPSYSQQVACKSNSHLTILGCTFAVSNNEQGIRFLPDGPGPAAKCAIAHSYWVGTPQKTAIRLQDIDGCDVSYCSIYQEGGIQFGQDEELAKDCLIDSNKILIDAAASTTSAGMVFNGMQSIFIRNNVIRVDKDYVEIIFGNTMAVGKPPDGFKDVDMACNTFIFKYTGVNHANLIGKPQDYTADNTNLYGNLFAVSDQWVTDGSKDYVASGDWSSYDYNVFRDHGASSDTFFGAITQTTFEALPQVTNSILEKVVNSDFTPGVFRPPPTATLTIGTIPAGTIKGIYFDYHLKVRPTTGTIYAGAVDAE